MNATLSKSSSFTYDQAVAALPEALGSEGFGVLTEIDVADVLRRKLGVTFRRYKIFGACNPPLAHEALSASLDVGTMLPCNVVIYEGDDGRAVVSAIDPMQTIAASDPRLAKVAQTVRDKLLRVLARLS